jgi:glutaredoxin 2
LIKCQFCKREFEKFQSLGGHISKAHQKQSETYQKKIIRRNERQPERELLRKIIQLTRLEQPGWANRQVKLFSYRKKQDLMRQNEKEGKHKFDSRIIDSRLATLTKTSCGNKNLKKLSRGN